MLIEWQSSERCLWLKKKKRHTKVFCVFCWLWFSVRDYGAKRRNDSTLGQVYTRVTGVLGPLLTSEKQKEMHRARVRID